MVANPSISIGGKNSSFADIMKALLNYVGLLGLEYSVSLADAGMTGIGKDRMSTGYLPTCNGSIFVRFARFAKLWMKSKDVLPLLERLTEQHEIGKESTIVHSKRNVFYSSNNESIWVLVKAENYFVKNQNQSRPVHASTSNDAVRSILKDLAEPQHKYNKEMEPTAFLFIGIKLYCSSICLSHSKYCFKTTFDFFHEPRGRGMNGTDGMLSVRSALFLLYTRH